MEKKIVGYITYHDSGEQVEFTENAKFINQYKGDLNTMGPYGASATVVTADPHVKYEILSSLAGEFSADIISENEFLQRTLEGEDLAATDFVKEPEPEIGAEELDRLKPVQFAEARELWVMGCDIYLVGEGGTVELADSVTEMRAWADKGNSLVCRELDERNTIPLPDGISLNDGNSLDIKMTDTGFSYEIATHVSVPLLGVRRKVLEKGELNNLDITFDEVASLIEEKHGQTKQANQSVKSAHKALTVRERKPSFTDEQYKSARYESNALQYAQQNNYPLIKKGAHHYHKDHDSMVFTEDGCWYWNSKGLQGRAIELLMHYEGRSLVDAVLTLSGGEGFTQTQQSQNQQSQQSKEKSFSPPVNGKNYKQLFGYLIAGRGLDKDIVKALVEQEMIYPMKHEHNGKQMHNAVFVGRDEDGMIRSAFQRGCSTYSGFKMETAGSDKTCPFTIAGKSGAQKLCIFEGAIDAISHASVQKVGGQEWDSMHRISQGGNAPIEATMKFLAAHPEVTIVGICMDSDNAGQAIAEKLSENLRAAGWEGTITSEAVPVGKDWNDYLQRWRAVVKDYKQLPTHERVGSENHTYGRIHHIDEHGHVRKTESYHDKSAWNSDTRSYINLNSSVVIETPEQIQQNQMLEQKKTAGVQQNHDVGPELG